MPTSPESLKDMSPSPVQTYATFPEPVKSAVASVEDSVDASVSPAKAAAAEVTASVPPRTAANHTLFTFLISVPPLYI